MSLLHVVVAIETILVVGLAAWVWSRSRRPALRPAADPAQAGAEPVPRPSDANFVTAFRSNPCIMTITRVSDSRFLDVNESFERLTGYSRDEVLSRTFQEFGMWIDLEDLAAAEAEMQREGRLDGREIRYRTKSGVPATAVYSTNVIMFDGEPCMLAMGLDITDRKNAEIQAAALREELAHVGRVTLVDALTGSIAHEINQPLTAVMANAEAGLRLMATASPPLGEVRETLSDILRDNKRAGDVLLRMRALLKKDASRYEPLEVNGVVGEVVELVRSNAIGRRIVLDVELAPSLAPVLGDRIQIQQVVLNLLMNAFDAVEECEIVDRRVSLRTKPSDRVAIVEVSDRGPGLSVEAVSRVFEPFYTTKPDGMGLGLSICRAIVAAYGGTIAATPNAGTGMTFAASFPVWQPLDANQSGSPGTPRFQEQR